MIEFESDSPESNAKFKIFPPTGTKDSLESKMTWSCDIKYSVKYVVKLIQVIGSPSKISSFSSQTCLSQRWNFLSLKKSQKLSHTCLQNYLSNITQTHDFPERKNNSKDEIKMLGAKRLLLFAFHEEYGGCGSMISTKT